ncbi:glutaredoxin [Salirhabdus euzebyi]|uniref:Glutaredoxin n=1 Tax=Salirhabdus euzebyi TaxID=394506 RepID=A0A841Q5D9_9BACI|nr:glutaredoxin family protein [Salirhabdus euzebyi]MBB6453573.1 glutaredoxin [Salirhabdus euzebyi]
MTNEVILYTKEKCPLCDEARALLQVFQNTYHFEIVEKDIYKDDELLEKYQISIPVVEYKGVQLDGSEIDYMELRNLFDKMV